MSTQIQTGYNQLLQKVSSLEGKKELLKTQMDKLSKELDNLSVKEKLSNECIQLMQRVTQQIQEETTQKIADIVTRAYQYVFCTDDEFIIKLELKRKVPSAQFLIKSKRGSETIYLDPLEEEGGGKADIVALGLRIAGLLLCSPVLNKVLIFDEPLKNVSVSADTFRYKERAAQFLRDISEEYRVQIILVTHDKEFERAAHSVFNVALNNEKISVVTRIT